MVRINVANRNLTVDERAGRSRVVRYDYLVIADGARHSYFEHNEWESIAPEITSIDPMPLEIMTSAPPIPIARRIRVAEPYVSVQELRRSRRPADTRRSRTSGSF